MPDEGPLILAFDTSAAHCAAALLSGTRLLEDVSEAMTKGQAERLLPLCRDLMRRHGRNFDDLAAIGTGIGPGNFTGIRIAVSAARGLALGLGIPAVGVSAFDALRYGTEGPCACSVQGVRGKVYFQVQGPDGASPATLAEADEIPPHEGPLIGSGGRPPLFATAAAIAFLTRNRFETVQDRPAPLYLQPADAAPARDAPPVILS